MKTSLLTVTVLLALATAGSAATTPAPNTAYTEVVVTLASSPLAVQQGLQRSGAVTRAGVLNLRSLSSSRYLGRLSSAQAGLSRRIAATIPGAKVTWHYRIVANGLAVSLPANELSRLARVPGVARVYNSYRYHRREGVTPADISLIGAPDLWGTDLSNAGQGIKIGIIDDGIDQKHPYFDPTSFTMPDGFPKGDTAYTTTKVIVARSFAPPRLNYKNATLPFDPQYSDHGIHVAGIAAGNAATSVMFNEQAFSLSGVAPRAYLGNYKVLSVPTENFGLDGNSPEIVAGIEAAVSDGMNVINLSLGEPEIDPRNDIVSKALNAASDAGVVVAVAAGNEYGENGAGSVGSPGSTSEAISVAASTTGEGGAPDRIAAFSSSGPTPFDLLLKPDVSAPGVGILSSVPSSEGLWDRESGTSMATPHVAGAAALLRQHHPDWSVAQIKSALVLTGAPVIDSGGREVSPLREGGGRIALMSADQPLVFSSPSSVSFGFLSRGRRLARNVEISDAGGNVGSCEIAVRRFHSTPGASLSAPTSVSVPGTLSLEASAGGSAAAGDLDGWIVLTCAGQQRRIPFWLRVSVPQLGRKAMTPLVHPGIYEGDTSGRTALITSYRYPERAEGVPRLLRGPEQVFRIRVTHSLQNFGVVVLSHDRGVSVSPRIVRARSEDRLAGLTALPLIVNPYLDLWGYPAPVAGALKPGPGQYDIIFDTTSAKAAGHFRFRLWIDDRTPPRIRLVSRKAGVVTLRITDRGAGVDPHSIAATLGTRNVKVAYDSQTGEAKIKVGAHRAARSKLLVIASDYQELKNDENAGALLPNTGVLRLTV